MDERKQRTDEHPDLADLDALRTGEASFEVKSHVERCALCQDLVRELARLAPGLKAAARPPSLEIPAEIDARILSTARGRARKRAYLRWPGLLAAAASVLIAAGIFWGVRGRGRGRGRVREPSAPPAEELAMDIDGSGSVDIVDAYLISRRLKRSGAVPSSWDWDGDGRVGGRDVELVARRAVALAEGGI